MTTNPSNCDLWRNAKSSTVQRMHMRHTKVPSLLTRGCPITTQSSQMINVTPFGRCITPKRVWSILSVAESGPWSSLGSVLENQFDLSQCTVTSLLQELEFGRGWENHELSRLGVNTEKRQYKWIGPTTLGVDDRGMLSGPGRNTRSRRLHSLERSPRTRMESPHA